MSHWARVATEIRDMTVLREALCEIDPRIELVENAVARGYSNRTCEWVIKLQGEYDVGLERASLGPGFEVLWDAYGGSIERELGKDLGKLLQTYAKCQVMTAARKKGLTVREAKTEDGTIQLVVEERLSLA